MHPFRYIAPTTTMEAVATLAELGERGRGLAGGTDLLVQLRVGRYDVDAVVDLKRIPALNLLEIDKVLRIGAAVPCYRVYEDEAIQAAFPGIVDAASLIGGIQIQSRSTLGGNLCNAAPSADGVCPLIVHYGMAMITGPSGDREVPVEEFCTGPGRNALGHGEILVAIDVPVPAAGFGAAYERFIPRNEMDIAIAGVASSISLDAEGETITDARIALASVGPTPILALSAAERLIGQKPTPEVFSGAGEAAASDASPINDMRGTIEQRRELVRVLTRRTLSKALGRARGSR